MTSPTPAMAVVPPVPIVSSKPIVSQKRRILESNNLENKKHKKSEAKEAKDELTNLIDVLVSKRSADKDIIRKIVSKTRATLKHNEQPNLNYRRTQKTDLSKS